MEFFRNAWNVFDFLVVVIQFMPVDSSVSTLNQNPHLSASTPGWQQSLTTWYAGNYHCEAY
jgi:hypothetical protein